MDQASAFSFDMSYCGPPPHFDEVLGRWNFDPILLVILINIAVFGFFALRGESHTRRSAFLGAWIIAALLFVSPLCALSVALFSARVGHHVVLTMIVAPLLVLTLPDQWGRRMLLLPPLIVSTFALWFWHMPDIYSAAFLHPAIYWMMQLSLLASFTWLWLGLLRSSQSMAAGLAALSSAIQMGLLGALLVFAPDALYLPHLGTTLSFGLSPLEDQQLAGLIMWVPANLPLMALVIWRLLAALGPGREVAN